MNQFSKLNSCATEMTAGEGLNSSIRSLKKYRIRFSNPGRSAGNRRQKTTLEKWMKGINLAVMNPKAWFMAIPGPASGRSDGWPGDPWLNLLSTMQWIVLMALLIVIAAWYGLSCRLFSGGIY